MSLELKRGDHICHVYSTPQQLARTVAEFLDDGLRRRQRCWYVASADETPLVQAQLEARSVDVASQTRRGALRLISGDGTYLIRGRFDPEHSIKVFNDAIDQAGAEGFTGFRAAADMSWALDTPDGLSNLIVYEALLQSVFASCHAIGLCLYDRNRMPLDVINGALATHPLARAHDGYRENRFYDSTVSRLTPASEAMVVKKLDELDRSDG